jgi:2-polyprenyl-6-methoxyphenol hydroxylase-like FAD-dependent oxidoreductase
MGEVSAQFGTPTLNVHRADLQSALLDTLPDGILQLGRECVAVDQDDQGVVARFADGSEERGTVLLGADGGRSVVRAAIVGDGDPIYSGFTSWRAVVPLPEELQSGTAYAYLGRGQVVVTLPCRPGMVYWGLLSTAPEGEEDEPGTVVQKVVELASGFPPVTRKLMESAPEEDITHTDIHDRDPVDSWVDRRMVVLGDAAHQTTPFTGQGAGISMEDAIVLARELSLTDGLRDESMITSALESYQAKRRERANGIVTEARHRGRAFGMRNPVAAVLRNTALRLVPSGKQRKTVAASIGYDI